MTLFYEFIRQTYFYIIILIGILMAMNSMFWVDKFSKKKIKWTMFFLSIIVFVDFLAEYFSNLKDCKKVFLVISALYLILKPVLTIILMRLVTSRYNRASNDRRGISNIYGGTPYLISCLNCLGR